MDHSSTKKPINYRKLTVELWKLGGVKFFVAGLGMVLATPLFLKVLKKLPIKSSVINDRLAFMRDKLNEFRESYQQ